MPVFLPVGRTVMQLSVSFTIPVLFVCSHYICRPLPFTGLLTPSKSKNETTSFQKDTSVLTVNIHTILPQNWFESRLFQFYFRFHSVLMGPSILISLWWKPRTSFRIGLIPGRYVFFHTTITSCYGDLLFLVVKKTEWTTLSKRRICGLSLLCGLKRFSITFWCIW